MKNNIRIGIADDNLNSRQRIISMFVEYPSISVLFDVVNGIELLKALEIARPDIVLLDIEMPIMSGSQALSIIKKKYPDIKIIMYSSYAVDESALEYFKQGANAYLSKAAMLDEVINAISNVSVFGEYYDKKLQKLRAKELERDEINKSRLVKIILSDRENEIARLINLGKNTKEIAETLRINTRTVEFHKCVIEAYNNPPKKINTEFHHSPETNK